MFIRQMGARILIPLEIPDVVRMARSPPPQQTDDYGEGGDEQGQDPGGTADPDLTFKVVSMATDRRTGLVGR